MKEYTHTIHLHGCEISYDGPRGEIHAAGANGQVRIWTKQDNKKGTALMEAIQWCKRGCPEDKPTEPEPIKDDKSWH